MLSRFRVRLLAVRGKGPVSPATDSTNVVHLTGPITELATNLSTTAVIIKESEPDTTTTTTPEDQTKPVTESSDGNEAPDYDEYEWYAIGQRLYIMRLGRRNMGGHREETGRGVWIGHMGESGGEE